MAPTWATCISSKREPWLARTAFCSFSTTVCRTTLGGRGGANLRARRHDVLDTIGAQLSPSSHENPQREAWTCLHWYHSSLKYTLYFWIRLSRLNCREKMCQIKGFLAMCGYPAEPPAWVSEPPFDECSFHLDVHQSLAEFAQQDTVNTWLAWEVVWWSRISIPGIYWSTWCFCKYCEDDTQRSYTQNLIDLACRTEEGAIGTGQRTHNAPGLRWSKAISNITTK